MLLIAGLGNPGPRYQATRHNVGFRVIESWRANVACRLPRSRTAFTAKSPARACPAPPRTCCCCVPNVHERVGPQCSGSLYVLQIKPSELIVAHDELDLPFSEVRLKQGGGDGGNRGIRSVTAALGPDYVRIRLGIGRPPLDFRGDVADFVLQAFPSAELAAVEQMVTRATEAVSLVTSLGLEKAMNRINQRPLR